jgi:alkylation response protein AidB-like acyl-CoA dehydrogenase
MRHSPDEAERQMARDRIEVMTPLVKAYSTDMAWPLIGDAIQVYGGYGFIEEYPVAHFARDSKIYSLWEGTNFIQSQDLVGRKWTLNKGRLFRIGWMTWKGCCTPGKAGRNLKQSTHHASRLRLL